MKLLFRLFITFCAFFSTDLCAGSLKVNLAPAAAVTAGARWQVDGGSWKTSGTTVNNLSNTAHPVGFKAITGWITPAAVNATITNGTTTTLNITYVQAASLKIALTPSSGKWRIDGGTWRNSGTTVAGLTPGNHTIDYSSLSGYLSPASETISLTSGLTTAVARSYLRPSSLKLTLAPTNAQWRVDGGAWNASGATVANLTPGSHLVDYASLAGYTAPVSESATLISGQTLSLSRSYIQLAQVSITLTPATGQWNVDGGAWQSSGASVANLTVGSHTINYSALSNYTSPASESISLTGGQTLALSRSYTPLAQISINLVPAAGQWRTNGGAWQPSGASLFVIPGNQQIEYATLADFDSPASESVTLAAGGSFTTTRTYITTRPSLQINLTPASGQWRIDGGDWQAAGSLVAGLTAGTHSVDYTDIGGAYNPLPSESVSLALRENATLDRSYPIKPPSSLTITLDPSSAQWRVDGGAWQASGATIGNLAYDTPHSIEYANTAGYITPASEIITPTSGQLVALSRNYIPLASFSVVLNPSSAEWRFVGSGGNSPWFSSGTIVPNLPLGLHTIELSHVTGFITPTVENVTLVSGPNPTLNKSYVPLASFGVTLDPTSAEWRFVGSGGNSPWFSSGAILPNLPLGTHTIEFSSVTGFITPATETVELTSGINPTLFRSYTPLASLNVYLPTSGAQWRIDGGAWNYGAAFLYNLSLGTHLIEYSDVIGYITPVSESITLASGPNSHNAPSYTQLASLNVYLPTPGAQWRIDGGAWNFGAAFLYNLSLGTHLIEYSDVIGYITPGSEPITLVSGPNSHNAPSYTQLASLNVYLPTPGAQWRIDGGAWNYGAAFLYNLSLGTHLIEYSDVYGYSTPSSETIVLVSGPNSHNAPSYIQDAAISVYLDLGFARWRVDGGEWNSSGSYLNNLSIGTHTIDYSRHEGYTPPASESVTLVGGYNPGLSRSYTAIPTFYADPALATLSISLQPTFAEWRLDGGNWNTSGAFLHNLSLGAHSIEYSTVGGYITPSSDVVTLHNGYNSYATSFTELAILNVYLEPAQGQWRVDGGAWHDRNAVVGSLTLGSHTIEYAPVAGYATPQAESVTLTSGLNPSLFRSYASLTPAQITITTNPASGQWRIYPQQASPTGEWKASGATVTNLNPGSYSVEYAPIAGYTLPSNTYVELLPNDHQMINATYAPIPAQFKIILFPHSGKYRINGGAWNPSGSTTMGAVPGNYLIEFQDLAGYPTPTPTTITLNPGDVKEFVYGYGPLPPPTLTFNLTPSTGLWRVDGGSWNASGTTVTNLTVGSHSVEFSPLSGYLTPTTTNVQLTEAEEKTLSKNYYVGSATLKVYLNPTNGRWRMDGGTWIPSSWIIYFGSGPHLIEFEPLPGRITPPSENLFLEVNENRVITRNYQ